MTDRLAEGSLGEVAQREKSHGHYSAYHGLVLVYGGFLAGVLSHALWVGAYDTLYAVIPFSCLFIVLLAGMIWWQRRRSLA